jgi:hypothetical protein
VKPLFDDTHPKIEKMLIEACRKRTPNERLMRVCQLNIALEELARADTMRKYPNATRREVQLRVASRRIPADLMLKAFGWDMEKEGH